MNTRYRSPVLLPLFALFVALAGQALQPARTFAAGETIMLTPSSGAVGSTFTITNLGRFGIDGFTPIVNPPEAAILGVGRIIEKPAQYRGTIALRQMLTLSLTHDHRLVDGAPAAAFLQSLADLLETPYLLGNA